MFTGTPPATRRNTRGTPAARGGQQDYLPPLRSRLSVSYGSPFADVPPRRRTVEVAKPLTEQLQYAVQQAQARRQEQGLPLLQQDGNGSEDEENLSDSAPFDDSVMDSPEKQEYTPPPPDHASLASSPEKASQIVSSDDEDVDPPVHVESEGEVEIEPPKPKAEPSKTRKRQPRKKTETTSKTPARRNPPRRARASTPRRGPESDDGTTPSPEEEADYEVETIETAANLKESTDRLRPVTAESDWRDEESFYNYPLDSTTTDTSKSLLIGSARKETAPEPVQSPPEAPEEPDSAAPESMYDRLRHGVRFYYFMFQDIISALGGLTALVLVMWAFTHEPVRYALKESVMRPVNRAMGWKHVFKMPLFKPESEEELVKRLMNLERELSHIGDKFDIHEKKFTVINNHISELQSERKDAKEMWAKVKVLEETVKQQKDLLKSGKLTEGERKHLAKLEKDLKDTNERIKGFEARLSAIESGYDEIKQILPKQIALRQDHKGKVTVRPEFLTALMDEFRSRGLFDENRSKGKPAPSEPVSKSWAEWLRENEQNLKGMLSDEANAVMEKRARDGLVVSRETVLRMLRENGEKTMPELEKKIQAKINEAEKKRKPLPSSNGHADALLRHNYDVLASMPDYAAWATGSRIDPYVTSPTYLGLGWAARMYHKFVGLDHPPSTPGNVLFSGGELGNCWPFAGSVGNLGVILPTQIFPTDITIEHALYSMAIDKTSAPKNIEFWVDVRNTTVRTRLVNVARNVLKTEVQPMDMTIPRNYVKIAQFKYAFDDEAPAKQVFSIPFQTREVLGDGNGIDRVLFRIADNYGNEKYTCLYRFRVHGVRDSEESRVQTDEPGVRSGPDEGTFNYGKSN